MVRKEGRGGKQAIDSDVRVGAYEDHRRLIGQVSGNWYQAQRPQRTVEVSEQVGAKKDFKPQKLVPSDDKRNQEDRQKYRLDVDIDGRLIWRRTDAPLYHVESV